MTLRKRARPFTERVRALCKKRTEGGTQIYVLCLFIMMFLLVLFRAMFDNQRLCITKDTVDDALMTSLVGACIYNREEMRSSGSLVIFKKVTPLAGETLSLSPGGIPYVDRTPVDVFSLPEIYAASDPYLENSWKSFIKNLKNNLRLGDDMTATISGIDGVVSVTEFSIYNKYYNLDEDRGQTDFKFIRYSYNPQTDAWSAYAYAPNTFPATYNSLTRTSCQIQESSVCASLSFTVVTGEATGFAQRHAGKTQADYNVPVTYQRVVDIKLATH